MENKDNRVVDVSSFLLIEGSADSETEEYEFLKPCQNVSILYDDTDAESCSCDTSSDGHDVSDFADDDDEDQDCSNSKNDDTTINKPRWSISSYKIWLRDGAATLETNEEVSNVRIDLTREVMDQMEDRLFWEACMAVGYP